MLNYSKLRILKKENDENIWADHIELFCLLDPNMSISVGDVVKKIKDEDGSLTIQDYLYQADEDDTEQEEEEVINTDDNEYDRSIDDEPEINDRIKSKALDHFLFAQLRQRTFGNDYPFKAVDDKLIQLKAPFKDLTKKQQLYIILLISSLLRCFTKPAGYVIAHNFERLCEQPFLKLMPDNSKHKFYGAGGEPSETAVHKFYDKVIKLSKELRISETSDFTEITAGKNNMGDGGLDWAGWFNFKDQENCFPVYFAQCACGTDWEEKQFDAHQAKWSNYLQFKNPPSVIHFIPRSFREFNGAWQNPIKIIGVSLVDRLRLLELVNDADIQNILSLYQDVIKVITSHKFSEFDF